MKKVLMNSLEKAIDRGKTLISNKFKPKVARFHNKADYDVMIPSNNLTRQITEWERRITSITNENKISKNLGLIYPPKFILNSNLVIMIDKVASPFKMKIKLPPPK
jgi:hypothetical protein